MDGWACGRCAGDWHCRRVGPGPLQQASLRAQAPPPVHERGGGGNGRRLPLFMARQATQDTQAHSCRCACGCAYQLVDTAGRACLGLRVPLHTPARTNSTDTLRKSESVPSLLALAIRIRHWQHQLRLRCEHTFWQRRNPNKQGFLMATCGS
jgi:hypothetical protein